MYAAGNNCKYTSRRQKRWQQEQIQNQGEKENETRTTRKKMLCS
jgi:hypothetical protein